ncbi:type ISP restriction/modification enzyme [Arthrobacter koreensis]|uniref:type ISP restriction/modification enzyme n=1 Tax=Arthrobacter koreensis TaxID=199136 RepID=UPI0036DAA456
MSSKQTAVEAVRAYVQKVAELATNPIAREHSYRPALVHMFNAVATEVETFNDPARSSEGQPDFVFVQKTNAEIVRGYGEAKDLAEKLDKIEKTEQLIRYSGYDSLLLTNELEFRFYSAGELYSTVHVARLDELGHVVPLEANFEKLVSELQAFVDLPPVKITSATKLAISMGGKARRVKDYVLEALARPTGDGDHDLAKVFQVVKDNLVSGMTVEEFSDMYAQTLIYGLFSARYSDTTLASFSRQEARDLIPASTPFLRTFFDHVAGPGFSEGLARIVGEMCDVLTVSDVEKIVHRQLATHDDASGRDPIIHFYEDFLREYDAGQRKARGAYYTPTPVVRFIIRAVDDVLKNDLGIPEGLSDSSKKQIVVQTQPGLARKPGNIKKTMSTQSWVEVHKVQVLDFATGTATFLNELIKHVRRGFDGQEGLWPSYAREHLIPRLSGFELMMAPYAIAHMKLGMTMGDLGVTGANQFRVYLTNTLEKPRNLNPDLFQIGLLEALTAESTAASEVKEQRPIMVVIGNPPYSGESSNNFAHANQLVNKYKKEPGGEAPLDERNTKWLSNDYVKFISFAEDLIAKNGSGVIGVITDNSYLMSPTFRGMRWHLANTFDRLLILDLNGRKIAGDKPDAMDSDQNVFDIRQGVSILIAVKNSTKPAGALAEVQHAELKGSRSSKFTALNKDELEWETLKLDQKMFYFKPTGEADREDYDRGIALNHIFNLKSVGIAAGRDALAINTDRNRLVERLRDFVALDPEAARRKYALGKDVRDWQVSAAQGDIGTVDLEKVVQIIYRPFDQRWTYYTGVSKGLHCYPRDAVSKQLIGRDNLALCFTRRIEQDRPFADALVTDKPIQFHSLSIKESNYFAPLWVFDGAGVKHANFGQGVLRSFSKHLSGEPTPRNLFDYIYGMLHDPAYRLLNQEALRLDYPKIPVPMDDTAFESYRSLGARLVSLHTMKTPDLDTVETTFPQAGDNEVDRYEYSDGRVWINAGQYFGNVSRTTWDLLIGSYSPALKWLKDRKGTKLSSNDIRYYQRLLRVLQLTDEATVKFASPLVGAEGVSV